MKLLTIISSAFVTLVKKLLQESKKKSMNCRLKEGMNTHLVLIGIVAILVGIGLSGCTGNPTNQISISELKLFPELYVNKTYTIYGEYIHSRGFGENGTWYYTDLVTYKGEFLYLTFSKITKPEVQNGNVYYFTGKLVNHEKVAYDPFDYWLEVTHVESP